MIPGPINLARRGGLSIGGRVPQMPQQQAPAVPVEPPSSSRTYGLAEALQPIELQSADPIEAISKALAGGLRGIEAGREREREEFRTADAARREQKQADRRERGYAAALEAGNDVQGTERTNAMANALAGYGMGEQALELATQQPRNQPETRVTQSGTFWREGDGGAPQIMGRDPNWQPPSYTVQQPPSGYRSTQGGDLEAIPGGPADVRANAEGRSRVAQMDASARSLQNAVDALNEAEGLVSGWSTGAAGQVTRGIGGTPARDLDQALEPVRAILSFETLAEMRRNSTTGGALGSIAVRELELLGNTMRSLDTAQSEGAVRSAIVTVRNQLSRTLRAIEAARAEVSGGGEAPTEAPPRRLRWNPQSGQFENAN